MPGTCSGGSGSARSAISAQRSMHSVEEVLVRDHPEPPGGDGVGDGIGDATPACAPRRGPARCGARITAFAGSSSGFAPSSLGQLRSASTMLRAHPAGAQHADADRQPGDLHRVVQVLGHRHDGVLGGVVARRRSPGNSPAIDAVLTMCPPPTRWGRNARQPCTTPQKFTPITHSHDADRAEPRVGPGGDAGVVAHDVDGAEVLDASRSARPCTSASLLTSDVHRQHVDAAGPEPLGRRRRARRPGRRPCTRCRPARGEALRQRQPDAARAARDDGDLSLARAPCASPSFTLPGRR